MHHGMSPPRHLGGMLVAAGVVLGGLVLLGVPAGTALGYALVLACPAMMVWMMLSMSRPGRGGPDEDHGTPSADRPADDREALGGR